MSEKTNTQQAAQRRRTTNLCDTCAHWLRQGAESGSGECRRYPPTNFANGFSQWPKTPASAWCGEQQPTEAAAVREKVRPARA